MKLQLLIFSIFLITLVTNSDINSVLMTINSERTFSNLYAYQRYNYTISALTNYKYTFKIKVKSTSISSSSYLSISYIGHKNRYPDTISSLNVAQGSLYLDYSSYSSSYNTYEYTYTVSNYNIYYLTFVLTPSKGIDSVSITITRTYSSNSSSSSSSSAASAIVFIIVFFSIFSFCVIFCIAFVFCKACCDCFRISPAIEPVHKPNYTPLTPQYQQPMPIQPQPQPQYMAPPQYTLQNQYAQPPQYINPQQNINGYAPGQLYSSS